VSFFIIYINHFRAAQRDRNASSALAFATNHILGLLGNILLGGNAAFNPYLGVRSAICCLILFVVFERL
jgi:hypothetical protein